jgi:hypothetical protein
MNIVGKKKKKELGRNEKKVNSKRLNIYYIKHMKKKRKKIFIYSKNNEIKQKKKKSE